MPSGICNKTGKSNCELPQAVEAKIKAHKDKPSATNKIDAIIDLIMPIITSADVSFCPVDTALSNSFGIQTPTIDVANISIALLNLDCDLLKKRIEEDNYASAMTMIIYRLNAYLPIDLRYKTYRAMSTINCREGLKEKIREFIFAICTFCMKIEDSLTIRYALNPKAVNNLEILKRRYKTEWADNNGKSIAVTNTNNETDSKIEIVIKDA